MKKIWLGLFFFGFTALAVAGQQTLTTYYPAPSGNYQSLTTEDLTVETALAVPTITVSNEFKYTGTTPLAFSFANITSSPSIYKAFVAVEGPGWNVSNPQRPLFDLSAQGSGTAGMRIKNQGKTWSLGVSALEGNAFKIIQGEPLVTSNDFVIQSTTGNIGIGTHTPNQKLDVRGSATITKALGIGTSNPGPNFDAANPNTRIELSNNDHVNMVFTNTDPAAPPALGEPYRLAIGAGNGANFIEYNGALFFVPQSDPNRVGLADGNAAETITMDDSGNLGVPGSVSVAGTATAGSISSGPLSASTITTSGTITAPSFTANTSMTTPSINIGACIFNGGSISGCNLSLGALNTISAGDFLYSSDKRLKENIVPLDNALEKTLKLQGVSFNFKGKSERKVGLIAQDVETVVPELVHTGENGIKSVEYGNIVAILIEAIKAQQKEIEELKATLKKLNGAL